MVRGGRSNVVRLFLVLITGVFAGILASLSAISFAHVIFSGPLAPHVDQGVWLALLGTASGVLTSCLRRRFDGTLWQIHSVVIVVLAMGAAAVARTMQGAPSEAIFASVLALLSVTALTFGVLALGVGVARLGKIAKSIPYPVVGGLLAAAGLLLVVRAIEFGTGTETLLAALRSKGGLVHWALPVAGAILMLALQRRLPSGPVVAGALTLYLVLFYLWLGLTGESLAGARASGLTLSQGGGAVVPVSPFTLLQADWSAVGAQWALVLSVAGIAVLGALLNLSALELASDEVTDLDRELRVIGYSSLIPAMGGGIPPYHSVSISQFAFGMLSPPSRMTAILMLGVVGAILAAGPALLSVLPRGLFAMLLVYVGLGQVQTWLVQELRRMPLQDYLTLVLILVATLLAGFVWAVLLGMVLASLRFTVAYARLPAIHSQTDGRTRLSSIERSDSAMGLLTRHGGQTLIFETQGYMFFGTANGVFARIIRQIEAAAEQTRTVVVDFSRVGGMDVSAAFMFTRLARMTRRRGIRLVLTGAGPRLAPLLARAVGQVGFRASLDEALMEIEDKILEQVGDGAQGFAQGFRTLLEQIRELGLPLDFPAEQVAAGTCVLEKGSAADCFLLVEEGRLYATIDGTDRRVATFLPGAVVGEIALVTGARRTASVIAQTPCVLRRVMARDLELLREHDPRLALELERMLSALLAQRLTRTTALIHAMGA